MSRDGRRRHAGARASTALTQVSSCSGFGSTFQARAIACTAALGAGQRRDARHLGLRAGPADLVAVAAGPAAERRVDHQVDSPLVISSGIVAMPGACTFATSSTGVPSRRIARAVPPVA